MRPGDVILQTIAINDELGLMFSHRAVCTSNLVLLASADLVSLLGRTTAPVKTSTSATSLESAVKLVQTRLGASYALALITTLNSNHP